MLSCFVLCSNSVVVHFNCGGCLQVLLSSGNAAGVLQTLLQAASAKLEQLNKPKPSSHSTRLPRSRQALQRHFAEQRDRCLTSSQPTLALPHPLPPALCEKAVPIPIHMQFAVCLCLCRCAYTCFTLSLCHFCLPVCHLAYSCFLVCTHLSAALQIPHRAAPPAPPSPCMRVPPPRSLLQGPSSKVTPTHTVSSV